MYICREMDKETRKIIIETFQQVEGLEKTKELIESSNVLCFTTMDRGPEETVTIEYDPVKDIKDGKMSPTNEVFLHARCGMTNYIDMKIEELNEKIDKLLKSAK